MYGYTYYPLPHITFIFNYFVKNFLVSSFIINNMIYHQCCLTGEVMDDCRLADLMTVHRKGWKEDRPALGAGEGHGTDHLEYHYVALEGQAED